MPPGNKDVQAMVAALFTLNAGLERARRQRKGAGTLSLLQVIDDHEQIRPSDIAELQQVHPSLVTRQVREVEEAGYVDVVADPADRRSYLVSLTPAGSQELRRLLEFGLRRFALFVKNWEPDEVRTLTELLQKLQTSMAACPPVSNARGLAADGRRPAPNQTSRIDTLRLPDCRIRATRKYSRLPWLPTNLRATGRRANQPCGRRDRYRRRGVAPIWVDARGGEVKGSSLHAGARFMGAVVDRPD